MSRGSARENRPQRKNETVIQTCRQCGAINDAEANTCCFCDARLSPKNKRENFAPAAAMPTATEGNLAVAQDWRSEVATRLEAYRARRRHLGMDPAQPRFPFSGNATETVAYNVPATAPAPPPPTTPPRHQQPTREERFEIDLAQPTLDFSGGGQPAIRRRTVAAPLMPVASLAERRLAGLFDAGLFLFSYGGFLALFSTLGGHMTVSKFDLAVAVGTLGLFYAQYFTLFTFFGGSTPGMMWRRLRVVTFDGTDASPRQLLWRSFGYMVSAATAMLGFVWAIWDQDHLSWHDRISQTYLTSECSER